jgi:hypothetical protein
MSELYEVDFDAVDDEIASAFFKASFNALKGQGVVTKVTDPVYVIDRSVEPVGNANFDRTPGHYFGLLRYWGWLKEVGVDT